MQLPDFIKRALAFFDKAEANLTAEQKLTQAQAKVAELEKAAIDAKAAHESALKEVQGKLDTANELIKAADKQIVDLKAEVEKEKKRANETIAGQGLPAGSTPAGEPAAGGPGAPAKSLVEQLEAITEPKAKAEFIKKNFGALLKQAQTGLKKS